MLRVQLGKICKGLTPLLVAFLLVFEQMIGLNPSMSTNKRVLDLALIEEGNQEWPRYIENIRRLLRGQHLADGNERHRVTLADMTQQLH